MEADLERGSHGKRLSDHAPVIAYLGLVAGSVT